MQDGTCLVFQNLQENLHETQWNLRSYTLFRDYNSFVIGNGEVTIAILFEVTIQALWAAIDVQKRAPFIIF